MEEVYDVTCAKTALLRSIGFTMVEMWECFWDDLSKHDPRLIQFLHTLETVEPLDPRHAFYGGRTGATCLYHKTDEGQGEKVHYIDVTSEYPWVNKYRTYPVGHPQILTSPQTTDLSDYYGIAKVDIVTPEELFNPVLPYRSGGKLTFPFCRTCVEQQQAKPMLDCQWTCTHTVQKRLICGTWCTPEIIKAMQKGYQIVKIHEIWHFPKDQRVERLFTGYVDTWLKMKQESSGRPSHVRTPEELQNYTNHYDVHVGIRMEPGKIVKNAAKCLLPKLMLNSLWGKFGDRLNKSAVESVTAPHELFEYLNNSLMVIHVICVFSEDVLEVVFSNVDEDTSKGKKPNTSISALTTTQARLKLYSYLDPLRDQVLYYDTNPSSTHANPAKPRR